MSVDSIENSIVNTAYNTTLSEAIEEKAAENAKEAEAAVLKGEGLTVTESPSGTATVAQMSAASTPESQDIAEVVNQMLEIAELLESLVADLQALATSLGLEPPAEGASGPVERMDLDSVIKMAKNMLGLTNVDHENAAAGASSASSTEDVESTYFSIYALMTLMLEIAQEQREAAFELSKANLEISISSIEAQAEKQRRAGEYGMIVGVVTCVLQLGVQAYAMGKQLGSLSAPDKTSIGQKNIEAQNTVKTTEAAMKSPEAAAKNTEDLTKKTSSDNRKAVNDRMAESDAALEDYQKINTELGEAKSMKTAGEKELLELQVQHGNNELELLSNTELSADQKAALQDQNTKLEGKISECQGKIDTATAKIDELEPKLEAAKTKCLESLETQTAKMEEDYNKQYEKTDAAERKYHEEYKVTGLKTNHANSSEVNTQRKAQQNLGQQRSLMEAKTAETKLALGEKPPTRDALQAAELNQSKIEASCATNKSFKAANMKGNFMMALNAAPGMIGQLGQSLSQMLVQTENAEAKLEESNQKEADFNLDQSKQLYSSAQDLINTVRDTLKAVYQAESQLNQKIIQA